MKNKLSFMAALLCLHSMRVSAQLSPEDFPGLELWLRSDTGVTTISGDVFVSQWNDISGNDNNATNPFGGNYMPGPSYNVLNGYPAITFYGGNDFLDFPEITNIRTVFWVIREDPAANNTVPRLLLGHHTEKDFFRGTEGQLWHPTEAAPEVVEGITKINFEQVDGTATGMPDDFAIISLVTTGDVSASSITVDRLQYDHVWWGQFVELLIYSVPLTSEQVLEIENYLANRYTQPFYADEDVFIDYGFCDTTICAAPGFETYQWSTGETSACIDISNSGDYIIEATDQFNRVLTDTIHATFDGNTAMSQEVICLGEDFIWDTQLDTSEYELLWFDNSNGPSHTFSLEGIYTLTITDTTGCILNTSVTIAVDSLSENITLGPDLELCSGNSISILPNNYENLLITWNDQSTGPELVISETGDYSVQVTDENDCVANDTIHVTVIGEAPVIGYEFTGTCAGSQTIFEGQNISSSNIQSWSWSFSDGTSDEGMIVSHIFEEAGDYSISLVAITAEGCANAIEGMIHIHELPQADFSFSNSCTNALTDFTDNSNSSEGTITSWNWIIDEQDYTGQNISVLLDTGGFQPVTLTVETEFGCSDSQMTLVEVEHAPVAGFSFSGQCLGALTTFNEEVDVTISGPVASYNWLFGDGTGSFLINPSHYFTEDGNFEVQLIAIGENGCSDTLMQTVEIKSLPLVDFLIINACSGQPFQLDDQTTVIDDNIISWQWTIENIGVLNGPSPEVIFDETGFHTVTLQVATEAGCTGMVQQAIPVWDIPVVDFNFNPTVGPAPLTVQFNNLSANATVFSWNFGDNTSSTEINPVHTYTSNNTYQVKLRAENDHGCFVEMVKPILVDTPILDIIVEQVTITPGNNGQTVSVLVVNHGNLAVTTLQMSWQIGNDAMVSETWNNIIAPGNSAWYTFTSAMNPTSVQFDYVCIKAIPIADLYVDQNLSNNTYCKSLNNDGFELFPPFPNPGQNAMFIRFTTPVQGDVLVRILDNSGRVVQDLQDIDVPSGFHEYFINISPLSDGAYTIELQQNKRRLTQHFLKVSN